MKRRILAVFIGLSLSASVALADGIISGPALVSTPGTIYNGIEFTALQDSTLTGFTLVNNGLADTVELTVAPAYTFPDHAVDSISVDGPGAVTGLNWQLTSGTTYYLLSTDIGGAEGLYNAGSYYPASDADISVISGVLNGALLSGYWASFNDVTTVTGFESGTPEPSTGVLLLGAAGLAFAYRRMRSA